MMDAAVLSARGLFKSFGREPVIRGIDLTLAPDDSVSVMGPSGCGKTTLLRILAGLLRPDAGTVAVGGRPVEGPSLHVPPERRRVVLVFQDLALFPHLTVAQNAAFGVRKGSKVSVPDLLERVYLTGLQDRFPHELSGGQRQRAAIVRALACEPELVLLDEPFANLDVALRPRVRSEVSRLLADAGVPSLLMTHDLADALAFSRKLAVIVRGRLVQSGTPSELYHNPVTPEVAGLLGSINLVPAEARGPVADCEFGQVFLVSDQRGKVLLALRPESLTVQRAPLARARASEVAFAGDHTEVRVQLPSGRTIAAWAAPDSGIEPGNGVKIACPRKVPAFRLV